MRSHEPTTLRATVLTVGCVECLAWDWHTSGLRAGGNGWGENLVGLMAVGFGIAFLVTG